MVSTENFTEVRLVQNAKQRNIHRKSIASLALVLVAVTGLAGLLFVKYQQAVNNNPTIQQNRLLSSIGSEVALPDEVPTVSTILDKSKITNPTLAAQAQNGDKLLIYTNAKRLILYRPSWHKVIDILDIQTVAPPTRVLPTTSSTKPAPAR